VYNLQKHYYNAIFFQLFLLQYQRREYVQILQLCVCDSSSTNTHRIQ